jgi:small GTP-binding protein
MEGAPVLKLLVVGAAATGKTSLIKQYCGKGSFNDSEPPTVGVDFSLCDVMVQGTPVKVQLWDIAGEENSKTVTSVYFRGSHGVLVVYDVTRPQSFDGVTQWCSMVSEKVSLPDGSSLPMVLIGNKSDLETAEVDTSYMARFCAEHGFVAWKDTSAKDPNNNQFSTAVESLVEEILSHKVLADGIIGSKERKEAQRRSGLRNKTLRLAQGLGIPDAPSQSCCR